MPVSVTLTQQGDVVGRLRLEPGADDDLAGLGELDGVAHQVEHDLAQAHRVADQRLGDVAVDLAGELEPLLVRAQGQRLQRVLDAVADVEVDRLELDLAGLDLGEVEDVVDDAEERVGRRAHRLEVLALLAGQRRCRGPARSCR